MVDTSALLAIVYAEPGHEELQEAIAADEMRIMSVASAIEASIVVARRAGSGAAQRALTVLDGVIKSLGLTIEPVTTTHLELARAAFLSFGKGMNVAGLNYGDCFTYSLAKDTDEPLLFIGEDFARTDIAPCH